jgi:hypothetical protein
MKGWGTGHCTRFLEADGDGKVLASSPAIARVYETDPARPSPRTASGSGDQGPPNLLLVRLGEERGPTLHPFEPVLRLADPPAPVEQGFLGGEEGVLRGMRGGS